MRAFFAEGVDNMHIPWAVEGLPTLLHLSLFLFFGGLAIFLFDVDREVFGYVFWWIGLFCLVYGMITLLPSIREDSPYNSPLSTPTWFLTNMTFLSFNILRLIVRLYFYCNNWYWIKHNIDCLWQDYRRRMLGGVEKAVERAVLRRLWKIDISILDWTITSLGGDDDSLKNIFEALPSFLNSKLVIHLEGNIPEEFADKYGDALNGFLDRTLSSNSINDSEKLRRVDIATNAMSLTRHFPFSFIERGEMPQVTMARILSSVQERDGRWITLAARVSDLPEQDLRENIGLGYDSMLLAILIDVTRQFLHWNDRSNNHFYHKVLEYFPNSTYAIPFRECSMTSVRYGTRLFEKQGTDMVLLSGFFMRSAIITSPYIKAPMLLQLYSLPPPASTTTSCASRRYIHSATSLAIAQA